ncbi:hypothetical protein [Nocardioides taihuensis]|uniref:NADH-quinone oxidoreductase subunit A n=1 Tax=Nocardioides taihuensis TaxID=1835606 RepID=A0ABW0BPT8_9ACTN
MTFELMPPFMPFVVVFFAVALLGAAILTGLATAALVSNRRLRVARQESIPAYYGRMAHGH